MKGSTVSRRVSEFVGVALFAAALIGIVALASYEPKDPVWFFSAGINSAPANFAGRIGAFIAELSFQLVGYAAYVAPMFLVIIGWQYFWCRTFDAAATKAIGAVLLFSCVSAFLSLVIGATTVSGKAFRAGGYVGDFLASWMSEYLNQTGSLIVIVTLLFLAVIISTQFSFGRLFAGLFTFVYDGGGRAVVSFQEWREERHREQQRREVIAKHTKKAGVPAAAVVSAPAKAPVSSPALAKAAPVPSRPIPEPPPAKVDRAARRVDEDEDDEMPVRAVPALAAAAAKAFAPAKPKVSMPAPPLPLIDPDLNAKAPAERRKGDYSLPPAALLDAPKTERKIDERELMDSARLLEEKCREFSVEGSVVQIHPGR